jgi:membrane-bound lytic murein transglycosylase B
MDRRTFLTLAVAGMADPMQVMPVDILGSRPGSLQKVQLAAETAPLDFDGWLAGFRARMLLEGFPAEELDREFAGLTADPRVIAADGRQPEFSKPVGDYVKGVVTEGRVSQGRGFAQSLAFLPAVEQRFGVPREILIAIWAVESGFGKIQGDMDVLRCMATLAADGRRRGWAESQIIAALEILRSGDATRATLRGSWAGAMGQTQFIPTSYLQSAIDQDGDGHRNIWTSQADALASAANLLKHGGWKPGVGWAREAVLPAGFDYGLSEGPRHPPSWWRELGVTTADGRGWSEADAASDAGLILPAGAGGPAFLVLPNHFAIRTYNNSTAYALAVGLLADRFAGSGGVIAAWPVETPLSLADRTSAQDNLRRLGFDPGGSDGVVGAGTRNALRAWQKARSRPADGYLSIQVVQALAADGGAI